MRRPVALRSCLWTSIVCLAAGACGDGVGSPRDAAAEARDGGTFNDQCGLIAQDCPTGQLCDHDCVSGTNALACFPDRGGTGVHGDPCPSGRCAKGHFCATFLMLDGGSRTSCAKYCSTGADCPGGLACQPTIFSCSNPGTSRTLGSCAFAP